MERYEHDIRTANDGRTWCDSCEWPKASAECPARLRLALDAALAERDAANRARGELRQTCEDRGLAMERAEAERDALREDIAEAKSYGVSEYAADVLRALDAVKAPPRRRDSHGAIEDVEHRLRALAGEREAAEARAERLEGLRTAADGMLDAIRLRPGLPTACHVAANEYLDALTELSAREHEALLAPEARRPEEP